MTKDNKPTEKQAKAMELIRQGEKPNKAMIRAGYSPNTALHPDDNLLQLKGPQQIIEQYRAEYTRVGITPAYMAKKDKEWLEAKKIKGSFTEPDREVEDYETQLKAAERVDRIWGINQPQIIQQINVGEMGVKITEYDPNSIAQESKDSI